MNVLIVEDEVLIAMHLELLVTGFGHERQRYRPPKRSRTRPSTVPTFR